tara:strand:+ start:590 stop:1138 length:549 start_codon:yes stop_codon:yes gene_type:complete
MIVLMFDAWAEKTYILIYYTMWTFILETIFFSLFLIKNKRVQQLQKHIFETIFAPCIVVFVGFWTVIAPVYMNNKIPKNIFFITVTHGFNAIAIVSEIKHIPLKSIWKPITYTVIYNLFLIIYVGIGGRSISGKLPYWYAQYDKPIGWVFAVISVIAVSIVHVIAALYIWPIPNEIPKQYIV